jgi:hypothetical protein
MQDEYAPLGPAFKHDWRAFLRRMYHRRLIFVIDISSTAINFHALDK